MKIFPQSKYSEVCGIPPQRKMKRVIVFHCSLTAEAGYLYWHISSPFCNPCLEYLILQPLCENSNRLYSEDSKDIFTIHF